MVYTIQLGCSSLRSWACPTAQESKHYIENTVSSRELQKATVVEYPNTLPTFEWLMGNCLPWAHPA